MKKTQYFQMEFKNVEVKAEWDRIFIEWFASTPDIDSYDDIVKPEAFVNTMLSYMQKPLVLLQHEIELIIWKTIDYRIESNWLWIKVELFNDINGTFKAIQEWLLWQFSIWFRALKWEIRIEWEKRIREITELKLIEVSVVSFPANPSAQFTLSKSIKWFFDWLNEIKELELWNYEVKSTESEIFNFEEEIKTEEIEEQTPPPETVPPEEKPTDNIEKTGETPPDDTVVKSEEVKALTEENETLKNEIIELKQTLEAKDEEIKTVWVEKSELENKYTELDLQVKEYLCTWTLETKSENKITQYYASYFKL